MKLDGILFRDNDLLLNGDVDGQIMKDLTEKIKSLEDYQVNHLDAICKEGSPNHYADWTAKNQATIGYLKRMVELLNKGKVLETFEKYQNVPVANLGMPS